MSDSVPSKRPVGGNEPHELKTAIIDDRLGQLLAYSIANIVVIIIIEKTSYTHVVWPTILALGPLQELCLWPVDILDSRWSYLINV